MKQIDIHQNSDLRRHAKALYLEAFPKEERLPWWLLLLNSRRQDIDLTAFVEDGRMVGFTASVTTEEMHFLLFFAIPANLRGQGWGSAILAQLQQQHKAVTLNVELLDPKAENFSQRQRRFRFYQRNGFYDTGYHVWEIGGKFRVLATQPELDVASYRQIFRKLSLGFWNVKLQKDEG
jgi:GNAT superfamily N-acetyltransferase